MSPALIDKSAFRGTRDNIHVQIELDFIRRIFFRLNRWKILGRSFIRNVSAYYV